MPHVDHVNPPRADSGKKIFTWKEVKEHNSLSDCWIVVQGKVYDVTSWAPRHPGGSILVTGAGRDSTAFMHSYHPRYVMEMLDKYCIGEVDVYDHFYKYDSKFYSTLKGRVEKHLKDNNLTRNSLSLYFTSLCLFFLWVVAYYFGFVKGYIISTFLLGIAHSQLGINIMHDGNHGAYSTSPLLCKLASFTMDLMGSSSIVWLHQHNIGHHPNANNSETEPLAYDPDASAGFPYVRLNPTQPYKPYMRFQHIYVWFLFCLMNFKWFINDIKSMKARRYTLVDFYKLNENDLTILYLTKALFLAYAVAVPIYTLGVTTGLLHFALFMAVCGYSFVLMFSVNHLTDETIFLNNSQPVDARDWAMLQVMTSSNFGNDSTFWTLASGGLNFQIEHHLFPGVNHVHLRGISPIVKQTCKEFGVPYNSIPSFYTAVYSYYVHLKDMGVRPKAA